MLIKAVDIPPAGRISHFFVNWQKLTLNNILSFIEVPFQQNIPNFTKMNKKQIALVDLELKELFRKGAISLSNLFLVGKKGGSYIAL